jgi:hypothetical protein
MGKVPENLTQCWTSSLYQYCWHEPQERQQREGSWPPCPPNPSLFHTSTIPSTVSEMSVALGTQLAIPSIQVESPPHAFTLGFVRGFIPIKGDVSSDLSLNDGQASTCCMLHAIQRR